MDIVEASSRINKAYEYLRSIGKVHTQKDIADAMCSSTSTVSKALNGDPKSLTGKFILRFNHAFGDIFETGWLLAEVGVFTMLRKKADIELMPVYYNQHEGVFHANGDERPTSDLFYKKLCDTTYVKWKYFSHQILLIQRKYGFQLKYGLVRELWLDYDTNYEQGEDSWTPPNDLLFNYGIDIIQEEEKKQMGIKMHSKQPRTSLSSP